MQVASRSSRIVVGAYRLLLGALDFADQFRGVLPVELTSFEAYQSGERAVTVTWATAQEIDVASMQIERAVVTRDERGEQVTGYELVERLPPRQPTSGSAYRVLDPTVDAGREYSYRLVSTSAEGVRTIEREGRVKIGSASTAGYALTVLPNPVVTSGKVSYRVPADATARLAVYDELGRLVKVLGEVEGQGEVAIEASALSSGSYTVRLESAATVLSHRLTISK